LVGNDSLYFKVGDELKSRDFKIIASSLNEKPLINFTSKFSKLNIPFELNYTLTENNSVLERNVPYLVGFVFNTPLNLPFDFLEINSGFEINSNNPNSQLSANYTIYKNSEVFEKGVYNEGDDFPKITSDNTRVGDNFTLVIVPYDGYNYGEDYSKSIKILKTDVSKLNRNNIRLKYLDKIQVIGFYDFYYNYKTQNQSVELDEGVINNWLNESCNRNYCLLPVEISVDDDFELRFGGLNTGFSRLYKTYAVNLSGDNFVKGDEVALGLVDDEGVFFISDKVNIFGGKNE
jgi:hypothetical protein